MATQEKFLEETVALSGYGGTSSRPHNATLFENAEDEQKLESSGKEAFVSILMKRAFVAQRTRPGILLTVDYLCSRVRSPIVTDEKPLKKLSQYIKGTMQSGLEFKPRTGTRVHA